jgi:lipoprotein-releasing system ATP-binding protein
MKAHYTADFRPVKPQLEPPEPAPKPSVRLAGVLRAPDGRTLLNPPTIELDELFKQPSPSPEMIPSVFKESVANSTKTVPVCEPFHLPFLFDNLPAIENSKKMMDKKSFYRQNDPLESFHSKIGQIEEPRPTVHLPEIPPLPNWERNFDSKPITVLSSAEPKTEEPRLNEHFEEIDTFLARNKVTVTPNTENNSAQKKMILPVVRGSREAVFRRKRTISVLKKRETVAVPFEKTANELLRTENLTKSYYKKKLKIPVLKGVNLSVRTGEFVSIVGQSGSGKSTLLHLLGTLDNPESGAIYFEEQRIDNLPVVRRDTLRNRSIGFIFQFYHLLPELTTLENVLSPLMIREGIFGYFFRRHLYIEKAKALLEKVGLSHRLKHKPSELSGGEMQRAAIARALISEPKILLADEPTGNLDAASATEIMELLQNLNQEQKLTIVMVTHDNAIANTADRIVRMVDGVIV